MANKTTLSRRDLFQITAAVPALAAVTSGTGHAQTPAGHPGAYQPRIFDEHQWRTVRVLCDWIVPADERSGSATQAGVPEFMDDWLDFRKQQDGNDDLAAEVLGGLAWLDHEAAQVSGKTFADAPETTQQQILDRIAWPSRASAQDKRWAAFFSTFRDLTLNGFYSSKMGIADLPYLGNTAVPDWKGADPAVWAKIEERMRRGYKGLGGEVKPWT